MRPWSPELLDGWWDGQHHQPPCWGRSCSANWDRQPNPTWPRSSFPWGQPRSPLGDALPIRWLCTEMEKFMVGMSHGGPRAPAGNFQT